jgi:predicted HTH transcriptional regulator
MARQLQKSPPGNRGAFLFCVASCFKSTPAVTEWKSINIHQNRLSIHQIINQTGCITSTDVLKATGQKPGTVRNRLNELYELGLLTRHGKARATWYVRGKHPE